MIIHIHNSNTNTDEAKIQSVPFKIQADCDAKVSKYFEPYVRVNEDKSLEGSFRGYPLKGEHVDLPKGYQGLVLHESVRPNTDKEERKFYVIHNFQSFVQWNWDKKPSKNDKIRQALDWIDIAEALHSPVAEAADQSQDKTK